MRLIDSHAHVDGSGYAGDRAEMIARARAAGVEHVVLVALWREEERVASVEAALALAESDRSFFSPALCVHPHDAAAAPEEDVRRIEQLAARPEVVAVGETGLDYHYDHSPRETQQALFRRFVRLAHALDKPVIVHTREADEDTCRILDEEGVPARGGVIHCFTSNRAAARAYLDRGLHLSFSGITTFRTAEEIREAARLVPLDRLMIETDAPYLAPVPHRGKRNEPAWVARVAEVLAEVKGVSPDALAEATSRTARAFFRLPG